MPTETWNWIWARVESQRERAVVVCPHIAATGPDSCNTYKLAEKRYTWYSLQCLTDRAIISSGSQSVSIVWRDGSEPYHDNKPLVQSFWKKLECRAKCRDHSETAFIFRFIFIDGQFPNMYILKWEKVIAAQYIHALHLIVICQALSIIIAFQDTYQLYTQQAMSWKLCQTVFPDGIDFRKPS